MSRKDNHMSRTDNHMSRRDNHMSRTDNHMSRKDNHMSRTDNHMDGPHNQLARPGDHANPPEAPTSCGAVQELLSAYVDGELTVDEKFIVEAHLTSCAQCQAHLHDITHVSRLVRVAVQSLEAPTDLDHRVMASIQTLRHRDQVRHLSIAYILMAAFSGTGVLLLLLSPLGIFFRPLVRLSFMTFKGMAHLATSVSSFWFVVTLGVVIVGASLIATLYLLRSDRTLRSTKSEVVI